MSTTTVDSNDTIPAGAGRTSCRAFAAAMVLGLMIPVTNAQAQECDLDTPGQCTRTSGAALHACRNDTRDDFWIGVGVCRNLTTGRSDCTSGRLDERDEGLAECIEQCSARQEVCDGLGQGPYDPDIDPDNFVSPAEAAANPNPFWPLIPGTVTIFEGGDETVTVTVTDDTVEILGVTCIAVRDVVEEDGEPVEDTIDWYAQDRDGNVWYFGEISQNFEDGELTDLDGSWKSGVEGAKPGIVMKAAPQVGNLYRQEFALGEAEDMAEVISTTGDEEAEAASCNGACLVTKEFTPVEPDALEHKYYAAGIGFILELKPGTDERLELVEIIPPQP